MESAAAAAVGVALGLTAEVGLAQAPRAEAQAVRITYRGPAGCSGEEAFVSAVRAQTQSEIPAAGEGPARSLTVTVAAEKKGQLRGELRIEELDGTAAVREVDGATCEQVVAALALMAALAIDAGPVAPTSPGGAPRAVSGAASGTGSVSEPEDESEAESASAPPSAPASVAPKPRFLAGAHGGAFGAVAPGLAWGAQPFVEWGDLGRSGVAPSFRLGVATAQSFPAPVLGGAATFRWWAARLTGCPVSAAASAVTFRPCAGLSVGALRGTGIRVPRPLQVTGLWAAVLALGRAQWEATPGVTLEIDAGFSVPLRRDTFVLERPLRVIHEVPALGGFMTAGVGIVLP